MTKKLRDHASAQAKIIINEGENIVLVSYQTPVIIITHEGGKRYVQCTGTYSATTRKHISWFLREYAPDLSYYDMKAIAGGAAVAM